jgi:hypothetical protein
MGNLQTAAPAATISDHPPSRPRGATTLHPKPMASPDRPQLPPVDPGSAPESPEAEVPAEVQEERDLTSIRVLATLDPKEIKDMTEEEREALREHFITALETATTAEARVRLYARVTDMYLLDTAIGAALPVIGDIATSAGSAGYLYWESQNMELEGSDIAKIMGWQVADAAIGLIPGIDLATDTVFPANVLSARYFTAQLNKLIANAKVAGVPEEVIKKMVEDADFMITKYDFIYKMYKWVKGNGQGKLPDPDKPQITGPKQK